MTPSLRELQLRVCDALYGGGRQADALIGSRGAYSGAQRLAIYRSSVLGILSRALGQVYPVVARLVGEAFFDAMARAYARDQPSRSGDLHDYGGELPSFIGSFKPAAELAYLADVARLEWLYHEAFHAAEHATMAPGTLERVPPEAIDDLRFGLHPAARLMASDYPVERIWAVNRPGADASPEIALDAGPVRLLLLRPGFDVLMLPLTAGEYRLLHRLAGGEALGPACTAALDAEPDLDLSRWLGRCMSDGVLVSLNPQPE